MNLLTDGLLMAATLFAGGYCWILSRRVADLKSLDKGLGSSIVTLTRQIELARRTLDEAQTNAGENRDELEQLVRRANIATSQLKIALAAARDADIPVSTAPSAPTKAPGDVLAQSLQPSAPAGIVAPAATPAPPGDALPATGSVIASSEAPDATADPKALRADDVLAPRSETSARSVLKPPPPVAPPRAPDIPAILSDTDAASASDWTAPRSELAKGAPADLPKPASLPPMASPLRSRQDEDEPASESDLIEALSLLAAGGSR